MRAFTLSITSRFSAVTIFVLLSAAAPAWAALGSITGTLQDPQGAPVPGAAVRLAESAGEFRAETVSNAQGRYTFANLEPGGYVVTASLQGFKNTTVTVTVNTAQPIVADLRLELGSMSESIEVKADTPGQLEARSQTLVTREDLLRMPGALEAGSLSALLETTPSAVVAHDQLHVRGGHQIGFTIDGVPVPSNSVGQNLALMFDPKGLKTIEFQRGAYAADVGDRTYGQFNIITRSGFERASGGEALIIAGGQDTLDGAVAFGDHSDKVAWFAQGSGNRTDFGLTPPALDAVHNQHTGGGVAGKVWLLPRSTDVLTFTGSYRRDDYQIPRDPSEEVLFENLQIERDTFVNGLWTHSTSGPGAWSVAPYYHFNRVALNPEGLVDLGASIDDRRIHYVGAKVDWSWSAASHQVRIGTNTYGSFLDDVFSLPVGEEGAAVADQVSQSGLNAGIYVQDRFQPTREITIDAGLRWDTTHAYHTESLLQPRAGITARIANSGFMAHGYAGRLFQVPPLEAVGLAGSEAAAAADQAFLAVRAERDTVWEAGLTWSRRQVNVDMTYYENHASNFLDHEQLGDSAVFFPVNIEHARLRGIEFSVRTPPEHPLRARLVYSHAYAEARGAITGGLGDIDSPVEEGYFSLDHDQRDTASGSLDWAPHGARYWAHARVQYGSGFLEDEGPGHLRPHTTGDVSAGVTLSRHVEAALDVQNIANNVYLINLSSEFNGTHWARPRYVAGRLRITF